MKLLVIIVTYNAMQWAERCFDSLRKSTLRPDVFVVDNGSTDGTQDFIRKKYPQVIFNQSSENLGFGKANNMGIQYALDYNYDYIYLLNQDAWVMPDTFEYLISISKLHPEYGILSPFQMNEGMIQIDAYFIERTLSWKSNPNIFNDIYNNHYNDVYPVEWVMASHWFMTRECVLTVGGFSPSFPHYGEDDNYVDRLNYWGFKVGVVPQLRVVHDRGWREDSDLKKMYLAYTSSIRSISNPMNKTYKSIMVIIIVCVMNSRRYKSIKPFLYLIKIFKNLNTLIKNKKDSTNKKCAFTDNNKSI